LFYFPLKQFWKHYFKVKKSYIVLL